MSQDDFRQISPDGIAAASFETKRRGGLDPDAVRRYLASVASIVRELQDECEILERQRDAANDALEAVPVAVASPPPAQIDEEALTEQLGQDAARVLAEARSAAADRIAEAEAEANDIRAAAEELHAQRSLEADREAQRIRSEAEAIKGERSKQAEAEAARIIASTEAEADAMRERSTMRRDEADAEAERIVNEAELMRRRILEDLARRRNAARRQIEQLRAGRERLLASHETVRRALDEISEELSISMSEARAAAETAGHTVSDTTIEELEAEIETARLSGLLDTGPLPVVERQRPVRATATPTQPGDTASDDTASDDNASDDDAPGDDPHGGDDVAAVEVEPTVETGSTEEIPDANSDGASDEANDPPGAPELESLAAPDAPASDHADLGNVVSLDRARGDVDTATHPATGRKPVEPTAAPSAPVLEAVKSPEPEPEPEVDEGSDAEVDDLFASLRDRAETKAVKQTSTSKANSAKQTTKTTKKPKPKKPSAAARKRAEEAIDSAEVGRRLKRVLADEQSKAMSTLKAGEVVPTLDDLLGSETAHESMYWSAIESHLASQSESDGIHDPVALLSSEIRRRVSDGLEAADGSIDDAVESLRSIYREVKTRSIETCVDGLLETAARGL